MILKNNLRRSLIQQKKGQLGMEQVFYVLAFLFGTAIFVLILYHTWTQIDTPLEDAINGAIPDGSTTYNVSTTSSKIRGGVTIFNTMFPFLVLGLLIFSLVGAYLTNSSPIFLFIAFIILIVVIILGVVFSNVYKNISENDSLTDSSTTFNITGLFMKNFPIIMAIIFTATIIALFALGKGGGSQTGL